MRTNATSASPLSKGLFCITLIYILILSLLAPFTLSRIEASSPPVESGNKSGTVSQTVKKRGERRDGQILVRFREKVSLKDKQAVLATLGAKDARRLLGASFVYRIPLRAEQEPEAMAAQLKLNPAIELAEPNYLISADEVSLNDPRSHARWALRDNITKAEPTNFTGINNPPERQQTNAARSTVIAVIDSGIDFTHPDLRNYPWKNVREVSNGEDDDLNDYRDDLYGWDWVAKSDLIKDDLGHGTKVAGLIASQGSNAAAISGVSWNVNLMSLRVLDSTGTGDVASAVEAIDYAVAHGAKIINCSWGTDENSIILREALERAGQRNVLVVSSAGNKSRDIEQSPYYPASYGLSNLLVVAATDTRDDLLKSSNIGVTHVQIAALGENALSTALKGSYESFTGTSASAALASAFAGLVKSMRPGLSAERTREMIISGGRPIEALRGKVSSGRVIDASGTVARVNALPPNEGRDNVEGSTDNPQGAINNPAGTGDTAPIVGNENTTAPARTKGTPGPNLPNLDLMRKQKPTDPKAPLAIPSTRCPLQIQDCDKRGVTKVNTEIEQISAPQSNNVLASATNFSDQEEPVEFIAWNSTNSSPEVMANLPVDTKRIISDAFPSLGLSLKANSQPPGSLMNPPLPPSDNYSMERLLPANRTGQAGEDLLSRNYNWSLPIVSLRGRAGLDLGLSLAYNSLVWTKADSSIAFDTDHGFPSPGFRLGFPVVQQRFYNSQTGKYAYLLITPSGSRVELRQVGTSNVYEATDSSYLQLTDNGATLLVRTKDGTQLSYQPYGNDYQCTQIKDRNGNYISATYSASGRITTVTDTLGRTLYFNYDAYQNLSSITQSWRRNSSSGLVDETHVWATFGWGNLTIQTSFSGLTLSGIYNGQTIPMLTQVGLPNGSYYTFEYTSWGQVSVIKNYEVTGSLFAYVAYNLDTWAGQTDCPRFTQRREYGRDWNNGVEAVASYSAFNPSSGVADMTMPDGTLYREYFYNSGWANGLTYQSEVWSSSMRRKWTTVAWTQDDTSVNYQLNPRPTDISIYDEASNRRRTTIEYGQYAQYGLPYYVIEYKADGATPYRYTFTDYNLDPAYISRHIIGLISEVHVWDGAWVSKRRLEYDAPDKLQATSTNATQHDPAYDANLTLGRGNLTSVSIYDVSDITNAGKRLTTYMGYDTDGSQVFMRDHVGHQSNMSYADSFSDGLSRNAFAYPTTLTDPDSKSSTIQYNYSMGVTSRTQDPKGAIQTFAFDGAGRPERTTNQTSGAYQRWVYTYSTLVQQFTTIQSGAAEAYTFAVYDHAGRMRATGGDLPNSAGGYTTTMFVYDVMGRISQQSNPTEMTAYWIPSGDDAAGWVWSYQQYDWKGRPTVTTNPDGTTKQVSYSGCGCAGGEVTTLTGESLSQGNRRQKIYKDVLGRVVKTEALNWDGSVYSAEVTSYNARDQVTNVRQYAGPEGSTIYQDTVMTYDYYGRLSTSKAPAQAYPTTYAYNADGTIDKVTDARGAKQIFSYNNRHLVTGITYEAPYGVTPIASVSYTYDDAGNRTSMTDGTGSTTYQYNTLSQLTQESRSFTGGNGSFQISYSYNLAGKLASITDPFGTVIYYAYDQAGNMNGITGSSFGGVTQYASNMEYRAWGALKHLDYGNAKAVDISYNSRLLPTSYFISGMFSKSYQYNNDGTLRYSQDYLNNKFDRSYSYDHVGRITAALSGPAARGLSDTTDRPYYETFQYDALGHQVRRVTEMWNNYVEFNPPTDFYTNDRNNAWSYDSDGRLTNTNLGDSYIYDAAGRTIHAIGSSGDDQTITYDGDGQRVRMQTVSEIYDPELDETTTQTTIRYEVRSSLLGKVITELDENGLKTRGFVYSGDGSVLAVQDKFGTSESVSWQHTDINDASYRVTGSTGALATAKSSELDPVSRNAGSHAPYGFSQPRLAPEKTYPGFSSIGMDNDCIWDGMDTPCSVLQNLAEAGALKIRSDDVYKGRLITHWEDLEPMGLGLFRRREFRGERWRTSYHWLEGALEVKATLEQLYDHSFFSFNAHGGSQENRQQTAPPRQLPVDKIRSGIAGLLSNSKCRDFVDKLLAQVFKITANLPAGTPLDVFDMVKEQGGFVFGPFRYKNTIVNYGSGFVGAFGLGYAQVQINNEMIIANESLYFASILHELIHVSGSYDGYDDRLLAVAVNQLGLGDGALPDADDLIGSSGYWDRALRRACVPLEGAERK